MAKKKSADEAVTDTEETTEAVEADAVREASVVEVSEALRRYTWHDDSDKTKMAEALSRVFVITARPEPSE